VSDTKPNVTKLVADYAASTGIEGLPASVRERGRLILMDELACAALGQTRTPGKLAADYATSIGGPGACRVLGTSRRTTAPYAALANGTAGHADEVDGAHVVGGHPGATIVHAVAAIAEHHRATGAEVLNAVVLGYEIGNRLIRACGGVFSVKSRLHMHADFLHAVGAAVAACRILGLGPEAYGNAMALATFQSNGLVALFQERRHISKSLCNGQYAFAGVSAALMARAGLEGCDDVLGAENGVFAAWGLDDAAGLMTEGLGEEHAVMNANFKFINAGYPIHAAVEAAMAVVRDHAVDVTQIEAVEVGMPTNALRVVDNRAMHNICLQDMIGAALVQGGLRLRESPFPLLLSDPAFREMRARINLGPDAELDAVQPDGRGSRVTLVLRDGSRHTHRVDQPRGHSAGKPIDWPDLAGKWLAALPQVDIDRLIRLSRAIEELDDVEELLRVFDP
jgi:2-methylcitrate dehydratase PrpD